YDTADHENKRFEKASSHPESYKDERCRHQSRDGHSRNWIRTRADNSDYPAGYGNEEEAEYHHEESNQEFLHDRIAGDLGQCHHQYHECKASEPDGFDR